MLAQKIENIEIDKKNNGELERLIQQYKDPVKAMVHGFLERCVEESFEEFMGPRIGEYFVNRKGNKTQDYRNGYREVGQLMVDTMALNDFKVPRNRTGGFESEITKQGKRRAGKLADLAKEMFINGISTRKVRRSFERSALKISGLSKSTVSRICKDLMQEYLRWANRKITNQFAYLQADTVYIKLRGKIANKTGTIMIIGITEDGQKEVLHFTLGTESESNFDELLQSLARRGLDLSAVRLITIDGAKGPIKSCISNFGTDKLQRCTVHKTWNIIQKTPSVLRPEMKAKLNRLWNQSSIVEARQFAERMFCDYADTASKAMVCLKADLDDLLRFYHFPATHRQTIRSTNLIERVNREVRRRTKVMDTLEDEFSCYRILMGTVREQNHRWENKSHWRRKRK